MNLWQKDKAALREVEKFTVGKDREMDLLLAPFDVLGSVAHVKMLGNIGLLTGEETAVLVQELRAVLRTIHFPVIPNVTDAPTEPGFTIDGDVEDIHSQIELLLTRKLGDTGKKIHSGRSRNDQVLVDIKLYLRYELEGLVQEVKSFFDLLIAQSEQYKSFLLPGYTHLQLAMPSSFGLWFGAYAESLVDDLLTVQAAYAVANKNPLGSAAGYGSSFPLNRSMTTELLGFSELNYNVVYAQMGRGKTERIIAQALANIAATLAKLAMDVCLFMNQNFGFIGFPDELTTGSSIMPHKKNPDVFELIRSRCNQVQALPNTIAMMTTNLPSGYHRDLQLLKEVLFPAFRQLKDCLQMASLMLSQVIIKNDILKDEKYKYLFSVEEVNKLVIGGMPFRDAYKKVGLDIEQGNFQYNSGSLHHTHEGSMDNLCNQEISRMMEQVLKQFPFEQVNTALAALAGR